MHATADSELVRRALEVARHELSTLHGLMAFDGAAPSETFAIDTSATRAAVDEALATWRGWYVIDPKPTPSSRVPDVDPGTYLPPPETTRVGCYATVAALVLTYMVAVLS